MSLLGSPFLMNPSCFPLTGLYQIRFPLSACFVVLRRVPRAGLASGERRRTQPRPPGAGRAGPSARVTAGLAECREAGSGRGWVDRREAPFSHGSQTPPAAAGARARTYWRPLLPSPPHDGRPPQLREGRSLPQELVVEEQDPLLLSLEQGEGSMPAAVPGRGGGGGSGVPAGACAGPGGRTLGK